MRALATLAAAGALLIASAAGATAAPRRQLATAQRTLNDALSQGMQQDGSGGGADVVDLDTGQALFSWSPDVGRVPASVEKLYTTATALLRFGPTATLTTSVLGKGWRDARGIWHGTLYLRGGGDPTFGSAAFDQAWYGTGATVQRLVANLVAQAGIRGLRGGIVGDGSYFDTLRGTPYSGYRRNIYNEGLLSGLSYDAGFVDIGETTFQPRPVLFAAQQFLGALRTGGVGVPAATPVKTGRTPTGARLLATVASPPIAQLVQLTNTPSDNYFAETLLKDLGASFGAGGTTMAGAAVVRAQLQSAFGIAPQLVDGSGLSSSDSTSPDQVVTLLTQMAGNPDFVNSLAVAGETGTLEHEMQGTVAQGRCHGKTGTLSNVANLAGYCTAEDGHTIAFAFLMNGVGDTDYTHNLEATMATSLAAYDG
ncbi:MAG: D-alanyl-D-alanine carboxypeptidase/D-alanyl-D-alanine-endopeptidase [Solirubrobacteraceae bacterium]|jgi:D-alanyl-D-alanine carboxypeptidase/D-alanyl-D-alanine-endopeptidase (penicillin-binding protein 4)